MTKQPALKELQTGLDVSLQVDLSDFRDGLVAKNAESIQLSVYALVRTLRAKAALAYLLDADRHLFFEHSYQAALVFDLGNRLIKAGMPHDENIYSVTNSRGFTEALLTYRPVDAGQTVKLMPDEMRDKDHPPTFWFLVFLMQMAVGAVKASAGTIGELRALAEKGESVDTELALCESLRDRNAARFTDAVQAYLARREAEIARNEDVNLGEEHISPEGLAIRRLAANLGMEVQVSHRLTPLDLQADYPDPAAFSRGPVPEVGPEVDQPDFWKDWLPVDTW